MDSRTNVALLLRFVVCLWSGVLRLRCAALAGDAAAYQLPDTTEPVSYELRMKPVVDPANEDYAFGGQVDIVVRARRYTTEVVLNSRDLTVTAVSAFQDVKTNRYTAVDEYACDEHAERLIVKLGKTMVPPRLYKFTVAFRGTLRNDSTGFHKYFYDADDRSRWIALTQFKPIYARRAFPCYDEPKFKTSYKISIARQNQHFALSNMPLVRSEIDLKSGWTWDHFEPTKPIPTYLVAFMVSDFGKNAVNNENIAMYTRKEYIEDTTYMMGKAPSLLEGVEQFTQVPYMLPKLDMVGVPVLDDYSIGNWGLNSYKEYYLTLSNSSVMEDEMVGTITVLREILHQWFGNMVTAPRWDYAWLNEGICNYLNYYIMDPTEPDWDLEEKFVENVHQHALNWDEVDYTHPLTFPVLTPDEIVEAFDPITLDKSASVFRMLKHMVGETNFKTALNKYLNDFAYTEAGPKELWETFDYVLYDVEYEIDEDITVNGSMYLWTERPGYPLVTVQRLSNDSIVVTQERFSLSSPRNETNDAKWFVGLTYTTENDRNFDGLKPTVWLRPADERTVIQVPANSGWIMFNLQSTGFYRVNYDEKNWKLLLIQLVTKPDRIHVLNRAQIVDDACHLSRAGLVPYNYYISLLEYLLMEDHVTPWNAATDGLSSIMGSIRRYPADHSTFEKYVKNLAEILYKKLSRNQFSNNSTKIGWSKLYAWSCKSGSSGCEKSALSHFDAWTKGQRVPPEMEEASFCAGMKYGNFTVWNKMYERYETAESASSKRIALRALACIENVHILFNYLKLMGLHDGNHVQKTRTVFESIATTPQGVKALANFLLRELPNVLALKDGRLYATTTYTALASKIATNDEIYTMNEIRRSVKSRPDLRAVFDEKYRKIVSNLKWMERDHEEIVKAVGII